MNRCQNMNDLFATLNISKLVSSGDGTNQMDFTESSSSESSTFSSRPISNNRSIDSHAAASNHGLIDSRGAASNRIHIESNGDASNQNQMDFTESDENESSTFTSKPALNHRSIDSRGDVSNQISIDSPRSTSTQVSIEPIITNKDHIDEIANDFKETNLNLINLTEIVQEKKKGRPRKSTIVFESKGMSTRRKSDINSRCESQKEEFTSDQL